ncbi:hypothetical protein K431DRAFT_5318 [Polychaeton citri CBS 116435]|uniref:Zn(2)-C6 fungal-type domain-containing protein n=1 Tax=Polychaeton citri CBS 116435 TaxID=1314669 RepID=A0A9P4QFD3_9PEZI|nr:hypothetical protein K431DRAFT_5318 [Polychaeton citri CBS 116435]
MQKRRSHTKSRKGCINCKKQHVKCDEQGPPCSNCELRRLPCEYKGRSPREQLALREKKPQAPQQNTIELPVRNAVVDDALSMRLLELELIHRWTTTTYRGYSSMPEDNNYLMSIIPRAAFSHEYLLHSIFAVCALEMAVTTPAMLGQQRKQYARASVKYYDQASAAYRAELGKEITTESLHILIIVSELIASMNVVLPHCNFLGACQPRTLLPTITVLFQIMAGTGNMCKIGGPEKVTNSPFPMAAVVRYLREASISSMDAATRIAFSSLRRFNDDFYGLSQTAAKAETLPEVSSEHAYFHQAISVLEMCFAVEASNPTHGWSAAFASQTGQEFIPKVIQRKPIALLILSYWAVLLHAHRTEYWWVGSLGKDLVAELVSELRQISSVLPQGLEKCISWAEQQVGITCRLTESLDEMYVLD